MSHNRNSRRDFLRKVACLACSGGASALIPQLRMMGTALASTASLTGYKALVCVYLAGGNDSWNMLVPHDTTRYTTYANSRGGVYNSATNPGGLALANPAAGNSQIVTDGNDTNSSTNQYFLHP
ncbi:MAG TPA: twin-arginine translocation signal domain-containing protein, partial [Rudaea sp.]|nr:twin-arginine translocation signal domain-containing protein [Rudaea sp.]